MGTVSRANQKALKLKDIKPDELLAVSGYSKVITDSMVQGLIIYFWNKPVVMQFYKHRRSCKRAFKKWVAHMAKGANPGEARWRQS